MGNVLIQNGRLFDPTIGLDETGDLLVADGMIARTAPAGTLGDLHLPGTQVLDAHDCVVCPGFFDLHCHLRQPGFEDKETIASGTAAAARGGFTSVCAMANTSPAIDSRALVDFVRATAAAEGSVQVLPVAAVTKGLAGAELTEMGELVAAGAVAFSDDGRPVMSSVLMRHALEYSRMFGRPIIQHSEDSALTYGGVMNEGAVGSRLGLRGMPGAAEEIMVARDLALLALAGGRLHVAHISTAAAVGHVRRAKEKGLAVTAEVTPHHLTLTDDWVAGWRPEGRRGSPYDTNTKVNPPLRAGADVAALVAGLKDGTIDAIATDHAPHTLVDKRCEYDAAAFGISGIETALGLLMTLVHTGQLTLEQLVRGLTAGRSILGLPTVALRPGIAADIAVFAPNEQWVVNPETFASRGHNTPLAGHSLRGRVIATLVAGKVVFADAERLRGSLKATEAG